MLLAQEYANDPELLEAILRSKKEEEIAAITIPDEPKSDADPATVITIRIRSKAGTFTRRFLREGTKMGDIMNYYRKEAEKEPTTPVTLMTAFPKKVLSDPEQLLTDLNFGKQETLNV